MNNLAYTWIYGGVVALLIGLGVYLARKTSKQNKFPHQKEVNQSIVYDRGKRHERYNVWKLASPIMHVIANKEMMAIGVYPIDDEISRKNFELKRTEEANMEYLLIFERKYWKLVQPSIPNVCVAKYEIIDPETEKKEIQALRDELAQTIKEKEAKETQYIALLYEKGNDEHDIMAIKKLQYYRNVSESKAPSVNIETDSKK